MKYEVLRYEIKGSLFAAVKGTSRIPSRVSRGGFAADGCPQVSTGSARIPIELQRNTSET